LNSISGASRERVYFANEFYDKFYVTMGVAALDKKSIMLHEKKALKLMGNRDIIPRKFLNIGDLDDANFSTTYSCNKVAFIKLLGTLIKESILPGDKALLIKPALERAVWLSRAAALAAKFKSRRAKFAAARPRLGAEILL